MVYDHTALDSYSTERIYYFVAMELAHVGGQLDEGEFLIVESLPLTEVHQRAVSGEICDSKTLTGLYWLQAFMTGAIPRELAI